MEPWLAIFIETLLRSGIGLLNLKHSWLESVSKPNCPGLQNGLNNLNRTTTLLSISQDDG